MAESALPGETPLPPQAPAAASGPALLEQLLDDQTRRWRGGERPLVEDYLAGRPLLAQDGEAVLDLVYNEVALREERREAAPLDEYLRRFPQVQAQLRDQFEVYQALKDSQLRQHSGAAETASPERGAESTRGPQRTGPPRSPEWVAGSEGGGAAGELPAIAGYELLEVLGQGGMGVVYKAWQLNPRRLVAVKTIRQAGPLSAAELARFRGEAQAVANLQHPHIVRIYEVGEAEGRPFFSLEYIEGGSLANRLDGTPWPSRSAAQLVEMLARAVHAVHQRGILHRDLKPANVLLTRSERPDAVPGSHLPEKVERYEPKITDFGLAKQLGQAGHTQSGVILGTPQYMAPEQASAQGREIGPTTDVYALGAILYELLTGRPPFKAETPLDTLLEVVGQEPVAPSRLNPRIARDLETICLKCLEKTPGKRYATAFELAEDLRRFLAGEPIVARPVGRLERLIKWGKRKPLAAALGCLSVLTVLCGASLWLWLALVRAETAWGTDQTLDQAENLCEQGKWAEARAEARRAEGILGQGDGEAERRRRIQQLLADLKMVRDLEEIRLLKAEVRDNHFDTSRADPDYARAFQRYGIDLDALTPSAAATRIRARPIKAQLAAALDDWAVVRWRCGLGGRQGWRRLLDVARLADQDAWRNRFRALLVRQDWQALKSLARKVPVAQLPPSTVVLLADVLRESGRISEAIRVLREAQRHHPGDFWLNHQLAGSFMEKKPPEVDEAIRYYTAALALRRSAGVHLNLGRAFAEKGQLDQAIACYREAINLKKDYAMAYNNLGHALIAQGNLDGGMAACRKAIRLDKHLPLAPYNLGNALIAKGDLNAACTAYKEAIRLDKHFAAAHAKLGVALAQKGKLDGAITTFRRAIRLDQSQAEFHACLGLALKQKGDLDGAIAAYKRAISLKGDYSEAHHNLGNALSLKGDQDGAMAAYRASLRFKEDNGSAHLNLGRALQDKGDLLGAITHFREAARLQKFDPATHFALGKALKEKGYLDEAIAAYQEAIRFKGDYSEAYNNLGNVLHTRGDRKRAIVCYREAIRLKKNNGHAHLNLGRALGENGDLDEAIIHFREATRLDGDNAEAHYGLGNVLYQRGAVEEAIACFRKAIRLQKGYAKGHHRLAHALAEKGDLAEAVNHYREAIRLKNDDPQMYHGLGRTLAKNDDLNGAISAYQEAIRLDKADASFHYSLGIALKKQGKLDGAIAAYRQAIRLRGDDYRFHHNLGNALKQKGDLEEALAAYQEAIRLNRTNTSAYIALGNALIRKGDLDRACTVYKQAIRIDKDDAEAHIGLGLALKKKGVVDDAIAEYQEAIRIDKDSATAHCNLGLALLHNNLFAQALACLKRAYRLSPDSPRLHKFCAGWVRDCERLVQLDARLPALLRGEAKPASAAEGIELAALCARKQLHVAATRFYREAFSQPKLAEDLNTGHRYNAACSAARAGCGLGQDSARSSPQERSRWRKQAQDWLRADLSLWAKHLDRASPQERSRLGKTLRHWQTDVDLAGVRDAAALAGWAEPERGAWCKLWADVDTLLQRAPTKNRSPRGRQP